MDLFSFLVYLSADIAAGSLMGCRFLAGRHSRQQALALQ
jgi:hypothetical protein